MTGRIKIQAPRGFEAFSPVDITTKNGLFYTANKKRGNTFKFNLPAGEYEIQGLAEMTGKPWDFSRGVKMPKPEKRISAAYGIEFAEVPSIGLIDHGQRTIFLDHSLKGQPRHIRDFVIFHELGHKRYFDELKCDIYATKKLLEQGYNPEQATEGRRYLSGRESANVLELENLFL